MTRCATLSFPQAFNTPLSCHIPWCRHHVHVIAHTVSFILKRMLLVLQAWTIYRCFALIRTSSTQSSADVILFLDSLDCIPLPGVKRLEVTDLLTSLFIFAIVASPVMKFCYRSQPSSSDPSYHRVCTFIAFVSHNHRDDLTQALEDWDFNFRSRYYMSPKW